MKVMVIDEFLEQGKPKNLVLKHVGLPRSSYYYTSTGKKSGKKASRFVYDVNDNRHDLEYVLEEVKTLLEGEFVDYGRFDDSILQDLSLFKPGEGFKNWCL